MAIQEIKIKDIKPGENYRRHQDKGAMKQLTASVKSHGVLQPIIIRKIKSGYQIIAGHRRHEAAVAAGLKTIPASILNVDDAGALEIAVIENTQREDPNPMDEAQGFKRLLDLGKHTPDTLAKKLDKSVSYVYTRLKLNDLETSCQKALMSGSIDLSHASMILRVPDKAAQKEMLQTILDQDMSPAQVRQMIVEDYGRDMSRAVFSPEACGKCDHRSTTQEKLFADAKADGDRCMDEKCWKKKTSLALQGMASDHKAKGRPVITGPAEVRKLYGGKGSILRNIANLKSKCKACTGLAFFYDDNRPNNMDADYGWWCPKTACYSETVLGMKPPKKKEPGDRSQKPGEEQTAPSSSSDASDTSHSSDALDKVTVPGLTNPVTVECPCCFMDIRLTPEVKKLRKS